MSSFPIEEDPSGDSDVEVANTESAPVNAAPNGKGRGMLRKKWIFIAVGTLLLVGVGVGLGVRLSGGKGDEGGGDPASLEGSESSVSAGSGVPTTDTPATTAQPIMPPPSPMANDTTATDSTPAPNTTSTVSTAPTPAPVAPVALPQTSNSNALFTSYRIIWQENEDQGCNNREHTVTIACPFLMLFYNGSDCQFVNEEKNSITCSGFLRDTIDVGCVGDTVDNLLVDVDISGSVHTCRKSCRVVSDSGLQFTQYAEGDALLVTTVIMNNCMEQPPLSCSETYAVQLDTKTLTGCGSRMACSVSEMCFTTFPESCFGLLCQGTIWQHEIVETRLAEILVIFTIFYQKCTIRNSE